MDMKVRKRIFPVPVYARMDPLDRRLIAEIQAGIPVTPKPYKDIANNLGIAEEEVIRRIKKLGDEAIIKRLGIVVRHHELGYRANAMTVWDIPDEKVSVLGACMGKFEFVTLCYRRPRRLPEWPYNLFTMIHGQDREHVMNNIKLLAQRCGLENIQHDVLFSTRRFKQQGALYHRMERRCS